MKTLEQPKEWSDHRWVDELLPKFNFINANTLVCDLRLQIRNIYRELQKPPQGHEEWIEELLDLELNTGEPIQANGLKNSSISLTEKVINIFQKELLIYRYEGNVDYYALTEYGIKAKRIGNFDEYIVIRDEDERSLVNLKSINNWIKIGTLSAAAIAFATLCFQLWAHYDNKKSKEPVNKDTLREHPCYPKE